MHFGNIKYNDISNGLGIRVSLFVSGCSNKCEGCFQPETWNPKYGEEFTRETLDKIIDYLKKPFVDGITILGGDPFFEGNVLVVKNIIIKIRNEFSDTRNIWLYSGYTYEELIARNDQDVLDILNLANVLVDGRFILKEKDISLKFRGSKNQRIIDLNKTIKNGKVILFLE